MAWKGAPKKSLWCRMLCGRWHNHATTPIIIQFRYYKYMSNHMSIWVSISKYIVSIRSLCGWSGVKMEDTRKILFWLSKTSSFIINLLEEKSVNFVSWQPQNSGSVRYIVLAFSCPSLVAPSRNYRSQLGMFSNDRFDLKPRRDDFQCWVVPSNGTIRNWSLSSRHHAIRIFFLRFTSS